MHTNIIVSSSTVSATDTVRLDHDHQWTVCKQCEINALIEEMLFSS